MLDSVIRLLLDSVIKKYYLQTVLEECKYEIKKNKMEKLINDDLDLSSSDESDNEFDNKFDNGFVLRYFNLEPSFKLRWCQ